jgi:hypothetical protein
MQERFINLKQLDQQMGQTYEKCGYAASINTCHSPYLTQKQNLWRCMGVTLNE